MLRGMFFSFFFSFKWGDFFEYIYLNKCLFKGKNFCVIRLSRWIKHRVDQQRKPSFSSTPSLPSLFQIPSWCGGRRPRRDSRTYGGVGARGSRPHPHPAPRYPSVTGHLPQPTPQARRPHERAQDWAVGLLLVRRRGARREGAGLKTTDSTAQLCAWLQPSEPTSRQPSGRRFTPLYPPHLCGTFTWGQRTFTHTFTHTHTYTSCHTEMGLTVWSRAPKIWNCSSPPTHTPLFCFSSTEVAFLFSSLVLRVRFRKASPDAWDVYREQDAA